MSVWISCELSYKYMIEEYDSWQKKCIAPSETSYGGQLYFLTTDYDLLGVFQLAVTECNIFLWGRGN